MRCSQCGLPLSPSRTHCPRCGSPAGGADKRAVGKTAPDAPLMPPALFPQGEAANPSGQGVVQQQRGAAPGGWSSVPQMPFPASASDLARPQDINLSMQPQQAGMQASYTPALSAVSGWQGRPTVPSPATPPPFASPRAFTVPGRSAARRKARAGFMLAGICIFCGAALLLCVFLLAQSPVPDSQPPTLSNIAPPAHTPVALTSVVDTPTPTAPSVTPTPTFPAQEYAFNAQMASAADDVTGRPTVLTTSFKVKQKMIVAWQVDPHGQYGAICVRWYINDQYQAFADYGGIAVRPASLRGFSYIYPGVAGPGYVELYWASNVSCTDKVLAQRVDFTVSD